MANVINMPPSIQFMNRRNSNKSKCIRELSMSKDNSCYQSPSSNSFLRQNSAKLSTRQRAHQFISAENCPKNVQNSIIKMKKKPSVGSILTSGQWRESNVQSSLSIDSQSKSRDLQIKRNYSELSLNGFKYMPDKEIRDLEQSTITKTNLI